jgi:hypothetical protein
VAGFQELKEDIIDRAGWSDEPDKFDAVDWSMHSRAQRTLVRHRKVKVMKLQHDQLATIYCRYRKNPPKIQMTNFLLDALDAAISKTSMRPWIMY